MEYAKKVLQGELDAVKQARSDYERQVAQIQDKLAALNSSIGQLETALNALFPKKKDK